ncbi:unnamed protein product [Diamesa tonsa]
MEQDYAGAIAEMVGHHITTDVKTIMVTVKCSEDYYTVESFKKYFNSTDRNQINFEFIDNLKIDGKVSPEREAAFFDELQECLVKIAFLNPKVAISLYEEDESNNRNLAFKTKQCNNLPEKIADLKKIKLNDIFLVSFESHDCEVEFCFFDVENNNTNPNYVFTNGYLNFPISQRFKLQFIDENIGYIGIISEDNRNILEWCVPIIIEKLKDHLNAKNAINYVNDLLGEPRSYRKSSRDRRDSKEVVVDLTERVVIDRINSIELLEQFRDEIECSSIDSSCCDIPIMYDKELKTWQSGWDEQCLKVKTVNRDAILKWIECSDFTRLPTSIEYDEPFESNDIKPSCSTITSEKKITYSLVPSLKAYDKDDASAFKFTLPVKNETTSYTPKRSMNMIPEHSKLFSKKDIEMQNSKKKETDILEVGKLAFKTVNKLNIADYRIPKIIRTIPTSPQKRSPIRPHVIPSILSVDRSAKKYKDLMNRPSLFENKRKNDNEDDVVFVGEVKKKPTSNDENNNGHKKHKLYQPEVDDELILVEDTERPSTSSYNKNRFKLFKSKNNRLQSIPQRKDHSNSSSSSTSSTSTYNRSQYSSHHKR